MARDTRHTEGRSNLRDGSLDGLSYNEAIFLVKRRRGIKPLQGSVVGMSNKIQRNRAFPLKRPNGNAMPHLRESSVAEYHVVK